MCAQTLRDIDDDDLLDFVNSPMQRPDTTREKEAWVLSLYRPFCLRLHQSEPFPLDSRIACAFLRFMAVKCHYALSGVKAVVFYALLNMERDRLQRNDPLVVHDMQTTLRQLKHDKHVRRIGPSKEPLVYFDVAELISRIPDNLSTKASEASLFLFALHTGSRAITCLNITYGDIKFVQQHEVTKLTRVVILQRVTKGVPHWDHPVCIEGYPHIPNPLDVVYWMQQHTLQETGLTLEQIALRNSLSTDPLQQKPLWHYTKETMRSCLQKRLEQCAFPKHVFTFHGLRSGFLTSCLLIAGTDPASRVSVLELTGLVANWKIFGPAQLRYTKCVAHRSIVSSRLVGAGASLYSSQLTLPAAAAESSVKTGPTGSMLADSMSSSNTLSLSPFPASVEGVRMYPPLPPFGQLFPMAASTMQLQGTSNELDKAGSGASSLQPQVFQQADQAASSSMCSPSSVPSLPASIADSMSTGSLSRVMSSTPSMQGLGFVVNPQTTEEFHFFKLGKPFFHPRMFFSDLHKFFKAPFWQPGGDPVQQRLHANNAYVAVLVHWARKQVAGTARLSWLQLKKIGFRILKRRLVKNRESPRAVAEEMLNLLPSLHFDPLKPPPRQHHKSRLPPLPIPLPREVIKGKTNKMCRRRLVWSEEEDKILIETRMQFKTFRTCIHRLPRRTLPDLYQRWRILVRKNPELLQYRLKRGQSDSDSDLESRPTTPVGQPHPAATEGLNKETNTQSEKTPEQEEANNKGTPPPRAVEAQEPPPTPAAVEVPAQPPAAVEVPEPAPEAAPQPTVAPIKKVEPVVPVQVSRPQRRAALFCMSLIENVALGKILLEEEEYKPFM